MKTTGGDRSSSGPAGAYSPFTTIVAGCRHTRPALSLALAVAAAVAAALSVLVWRFPAFWSDLGTVIGRYVVAGVGVLVVAAGRAIWAGRRHGHPRQEAPASDAQRSLSSGTVGDRSASLSAPGEVRVALVEARNSSERLVQLVDAYCRHVYPAVLAQHERESVSSPLGVWLLLAGCVSAATGSEKEALEASLGCSAAEAAHLLRAFVSDAPTALKAGLAAWVIPTGDSSALREWWVALPKEIEVGSMPSQPEADTWVQRHTDGLIRRLPARVERAALVLVSILATDVSWLHAFSVVARRDACPSNQWFGGVQRVLSDREPSLHTMLATTRAAGVVAVHLSVANDGLAVASVSADPGLSRTAVLEAAHEVVALIRGVPSTARKCSLHELPLGPGHSWTITERQVATPLAGQPSQRIAGAILPSWRAQGDLDLTASDLFGAPAALTALLTLLGQREGDADAEAKQTAMASFSCTGFQAAAITAFASPSGRAPQMHGVERVAELRFDHPYAAIAVAGSVAAFLGDAGPSAWFGLPLFTVWVDRPAESEPDTSTCSTGEQK